MFSSWNKVNVLASVLSLKQRACSLLQFMGQRSENLQLHAIAVLWWFFLFLRFFSLLVLIMATDSFEILLSSLSRQTEDLFLMIAITDTFMVCVCVHTHIYMHLCDIVFLSGSIFCLQNFELVFVFYVLWSVLYFII